MTSSEDRKYYNYIYCDPRKPTPYKIKGVDIILPYEPFYVGKGEGSRIKNHLKKSQRISDYNSKTNNHKINKINKILDLGLNPITIKVSSNLTNAEACEQERFLIKQIGRIDLNKGTLVNMTDGGDGVLNLSKEARYKMSLAKKGKKLPKEQVSKMIKAREWYSPSEETKKKISKANSGQIITETQKGKISDKLSIPILQYTIDGVFIKEYKSCKQAVKETGFTGISASLNNKCKFSGNYIWIKKNDFSEEILNKKVYEIKNFKPSYSRKLKTNPSARKPLMQFSKSGEFIFEWESVKDANEEIKSNISQASIGNRMSAGGFIWIHSKDFSQELLDEKVKKIVDYKPVVFGKTDYVSKK